MSVLENWKRLFYAFQDDQAVKEIYQDSKTMMLKAHRMLDYSIDYLRHKDSLRENIDIYAEDKELNELEIEIRRKLFIYQTINRPNKNYNAVMVMSLVSHDIERVGDYSKNVFQIAERYTESQKFGKFDHQLQMIENLILSEFNKLNSYFEQFNEAIHKSIGEGLTMANEMIEDCLQKLQDDPESSGLDEKTDISLVLYLRFLKRTSSHLRNIASSYFNPVERIGFKLEGEENRFSTETNL